MSTNRIKGSDGVVIESNAFLELPKALTKTTNYAERAGMFRYNSFLRSFEGVLEFDDGSLSYRRIPSLDDNGRLSTSLLPDSVVSGMQYMGTFSVLTDDIDPPLGESIYNALPVADSSNSGQYYIVRGILDSAIEHYTANTPTTSPVIFTPVNPSLQGNWLEIKYYFDIDPVHPSAKTVIFAFGRLITSAIPTTGHAGLQSLTTNSELTSSFTNDNNPSLETAFTDGDWVISNGTSQQRLRSTRTSITAGQVAFDRTFSNSTGRSFKNSAGTAQTVLDNIILNTLQRTGDSMFDNGSPAEGRLALVYGTAAKPSICFTDSSEDVENNSGIDPTKWTDAGTGLFRAGSGQIGFSSNALEKFRVENTRLVIYQSGTNVATNPSLQFNSNTNTNNVGISGINNTLSFSVKNVEQVKFADKLSTFNGSVTVGVNSSDTLQVNAKSIFDADVTINGPLITTGTNYFDKDVRIKYNSGIVFVPNSSTMTGTVKMTSDGTGGLGVYLSSNDYNVSVYEPGNLRRMYIGRYGVKLPVLNPLDDAVGEDGMIAYSPQQQSTVQKINGHWVNIGAGTVGSTSFAVADWVLSGSSYTYTINRTGVLDVRVQELISGKYYPVEVDSVAINGTTVVISIPSSSDYRFNGRVIMSA